ncbi:hypothetical protein Tco_1546503 [Tanacetum coccineum]
MSHRSRCLVPHEVDNVNIWAWNGDLEIWEEVVIWKLYLRLAFTAPTLERVTIESFKVVGGGGGGGGGGRVIGDVGVVYGEGVDSGVGGIVCGNGYPKKGRKSSKNDKTKHGMVKRESQSRSQRPKSQSQSQTQQSQ